MPATPEPGSVTRLLQSLSQGDKDSLNQLVPLIYRELHGLAAAYIRRERNDHTLQPTALVHEAYLRLVDQTQVESFSRSHFFGIAANLMRQILVNHARSRGAAKRGGGNKVSLEEDAAVVEPRGVDFIALDAALTELASVDPRQSQIVEMRYFGGLSENEIAEILGVSVATVNREWRIARAYLRQQLTAIPDRPENL